LPSAPGQPLRPSSRREDDVSLHLVAVRFQGLAACEQQRSPRQPAVPTRTRKHPRRGALLWEVDPARLGPAIQELSLLRTCRAVGESPHLDRPILAVELDRQKPRGIACGAPPRPDRGAACNALPRSSRRSGAWPASRPRDRRLHAAGSPDTPCAWSDLDSRAPRLVGDRSTRLAAAAGRLASQRLSTRTWVRPLCAAACNLDARDRFEGSRLITSPNPRACNGRCQSAMAAHGATLRPAASAKRIASNVGTGCSCPRIESEERNDRRVYAFRRSRSV
jgi:hypothetical protein